MSAVAPGSVDRSRPPELGPVPALRLPEVERYRLDNGLRVLLWPKVEVPLVQAEVVIAAGAVDERPSRAGLAVMTADMLDEGAGGRDSMALGEAFELLGARLDIDAGYHQAGASIHVPVARFPAALELLSDVVLRPHFAPEELDRLRRSELTERLQWRDEPRAIGAVAFDRALYGEDHPYGRPLTGTDDALRRMTVADGSAFHRRHFVPENATLLLAGDVGWEEVREHVERCFGAWEGGAPPGGGERSPVALPEPPLATGTRILLVDKPGAAQSEIRIGRVALARSDRDFYPAIVLNTLLGGAFTSRLNANLREKNQFTYGARSVFAFRPHPGPFLAWSAVETAVTAAAVREFFREFEGIRSPVPEDELDRARRYTALRLPQEFSSVDRIVARLEEMVAFDLPDDVWNRTVPRLLAVGAEDVERVARRVIDPERMLAVIVGDREAIESDLRKLGLGTVEVLSVDDVLGPVRAVDAAAATGEA